MHVLLIEDDQRLSSHICKALSELGHIVSHCIDGKDGLISASSEYFDAIVLDRTLPKVDGFKILQIIRATGDRTPVLILSALGTVADKVQGLKAGSDDYMSKPFAMSELVARVEALGRRSTAVAPVQHLSVGDLAIDLIQHTVSRGDRRIQLTPREFRMLEYLVRNSGRVVTRSMLLENVWDYSFDPQTNVIDQYISRLRQKVDRGHKVALIHTIRGSGYCVRVNP